MEIVLLISLIICAVYIISKQHNFLHPALWMCIIWSICFFCYILGKDNYVEVSSKAWLIIVLGLFFFCIGTTIPNRVNIRVGNFQEDRKRKSIWFGLFFVIAIITIGVNFHDAIGTIRSLLEGRTLYALEAADSFIENSSTGLLAIIKIYITNPFSYAISPICATEVVLGKGNHKKLLFFLNVVCVVLETFRHGGRVSIMIFCISYAIAILKAGYIKKLGRRAKILSYGLLGLMVFFSIWISSARGISNVFDSISLYLGGVFPHSSECLKLSEDIGFSYGMWIINPFCAFFVVILRGLNLMDTPYNMELVSQFQRVVEVPKSIGNTPHLFNAHVGFQYLFYTDFGYIGVVIGALIFGWFSASIYKKMINKNDGLQTSVYLFMMCVIVTSFIRYQLSTSSWLYALGWIYLVCSKKEQDTCE